jgi:hypothetical protein
MRFSDIFGEVVDAVTGRDDHQNSQNVRPASEDPYGDPADQGYQNAGYPGGVLPSSQDPYGDPADMVNGQQVLPASQDPYGDPADQVNGQQVLPASQDPYGDPADEEESHRGGLLGGLFGR